MATREKGMGKNRDLEIWMLGGKPNQKTEQEAYHEYLHREIVEKGKLPLSGKNIEDVLQGMATETEAVKKGSFLQKITMAFNRLLRRGESKK